MRLTNPSSIKALFSFIRICTESIRVPWTTTTMKTVQTKKRWKKMKTRTIGEQSLS